MKLRNAFTTVLIFFIVACANEQRVTDVHSPVPLLTNTPTKAAPRSTQTSTSTKTPSPTIRSMETIPVATFSALATTEAIRVKVIDRFPDLEGYNTVCAAYCLGVVMSPDGKWIYFSNGSVIELFGVDGRRVGKYTFYDLYGHLIDFYEGYLGSVHWSKDERYVYLATSYGDGGPEPYFGYKASLARVNLENGTWKDTGISGVFSFSPNEKYIVYSTNKRELRVRNLQSGEEKIYLTPGYYHYFGKFVWSPDNRKVIFVAMPEDWDVIEGVFALFMIDVENNLIDNVYEASLPFYYPIDWEEENKVRLKAYQGYEELILDLSVNPPIVHP